MKSLFNEKLNEFNDLYSGLTKPKAAVKSDTEKIIFILPLSGRYETFLRFLNNFEDVSLRVRSILNQQILILASILDCVANEWKRRAFDLALYQHIRLEDFLGFPHHRSSQQKVPSAGRDDN